FGHELEDLTLEFYALGDRGYEGPDGHYFDIYKSFDIYWEAPYSRVAINYPQNGWLINQAQNDTMDIIFTGYNLSKPKFKSIKLEYKHPQDVTWLPAFEVMRNVLEDHPSYITVPWDVSGLSDGIYEIRAATTDSVQANWYTAALQGTIDRSAPAVWGLPQPSDGILQLGDVISLSFSENLDPNSLLPGRVSMVEVGGPLVVDCNVQFNENAISIVPSIANYWMENKTFRVTVMGLTDIHGNPMASSVQWEFFVNANPVNWATTKVELIKQLGQSSNFSVILCNNGGQYSSFSLIDLPPWLSATPLSGNLLPLDSRPISFTVSTQLGFGVFTDTLYADIPGLGKEPLVVKVSVLASPPTWATSVVTNYDYSMTITGQMYIDNELSTDINDIIGVFATVNGALQCRGVAHTEFVPYQSGSYQFFLTIYSNEEYEEDLIFKVWDASQCKEHYGIMESYDFFAEIVYGTPVTPVSVHAAPQLIQNVSCNTGWNWITTNVVNSTSMNVNQVLQSLSPVNNDLIKDQTQYAQYSAGMGWVGSLQTISTTKAYKIKLGAQGNLSMVGLLENPNTTSLTYGTGWNWIGYLPHVSIHVNEALSGITNLQTGDVIKSQQYYAQYIAGSGWFGSLTFMRPGCGYMLKTANSGSFNYPDYVIPRTNPPDTENRTLTRLRDNSGWNLNPQQYEYTSNITAVINNNGSLLNNENVLLGAFYNGECRGYASPVLIQDQWVFFLTQYSNTMNQTMTYKVYLEDDDETIIANEMLPFINNQILGNPLNPYVFHISYAPLTAPENLSISCEDN
ncbi:MAG: Ig-like domain-containing protein, partial [Candidatus Cloacimonetes bacterium]|nr:Ig-like domain-containing protein [Candidatus Cloacimonadota bacterium]